MANDDFINMGSQAQGGDINIQQGASGGTRFLSTFLGGLLKGAGQEDKVKKERDKLSYYTELRKAGYSPDEAAKRVNKQMSGGFINKLLGKTDAGFTAPSGASDMVTEEQEKKAKYEKDLAATDYTKKRTALLGQPKQSSAKTKTAGMTGDAKAKQIQAFLAEAKGELEAASTNEEKAKAQKKVDNYSRHLQNLTGTEAIHQQYDPAKVKPGDVFLHKGKKYMVNPDDPGDPEDPNVLPVEE